MLTVTLTRENMRFLAAGKYCYLSEGKPELNQLKTFVEGAMWAFDTKYNEVNNETTKTNLASNREVYENNTDTTSGQ